MLRKATVRWDEQHRLSGHVGDDHRVVAPLAIVFVKWCHLKKSGTAPAVPT